MSVEDVARRFEEVTEVYHAEFSAAQAFLEVSCRKRPGRDGDRELEAVAAPLPIELQLSVNWIDLL